MSCEEGFPSDELQSRRQGRTSRQMRPCILGRNTAQSVKGVHSLKRIYTAITVPLGSVGSARVGNDIHISGTHFREPHPNT